MPLFSILLVLLVAGFLLWIVNNYVPMDRFIKKIFNIVVFLVVIIWLLEVLGLFDNLREHKGMKMGITLSGDK